MWKNERQQIAAIRVLLRTLFSERQVDSWWTSIGPTDEALKLLKRKGGYLSHGEAVLFRAAFDLWGGHGKVTLNEILVVLDGPRLRALFGLIGAVNSGTVDEWMCATINEHST